MLLRPTAKPHLLCAAVCTHLVILTVGNNAFYKWFWPVLGDELFNRITTLTCIKSLITLLQHIAIQHHAWNQTCLNRNQMAHTLNGRVQSAICVVQGYTESLRYCQTHTFLIWKAQSYEYLPYMKGSEVSAFYRAGTISCFSISILVYL